MRLRIIAALATALALTGCSGGDETSTTRAAADAATDMAATVPAGTAPGPSDGPAPASPPVDAALPGNPDGLYPPGRTPPTLPTEPTTQSPASGPPPR